MLTQSLFPAVLDQDAAKRDRDRSPYPDLIVWPETVLRVYLSTDGDYREDVSRLAAQLERPLFLGSLDLPHAGWGEFNSGFLVQASTDGGASHAVLIPMDAEAPVANGRSVATKTLVYHKQRLLPFGEYFPGAAWFPWSHDWRTTGRFLAGQPARAPTQVAVPGPRFDGDVVPFAPSICFEATSPGVFNDMVRRGAAFLVNITDDGWFGDTPGPYLHLQGVVLRAVETRRWLVRASNSGVSAFVDPSGEVAAQLPFDFVGTLTKGIEMPQVISPYVRFGNWLVLVCALAVAARFIKAAGMW